MWNDKVSILWRICYDNQECHYNRRRGVRFEPEVVSIVGIIILKISFWLNLVYYILYICLKCYKLPIVYSNFQHGITDHE